MRRGPGISGLKQRVEQSSQYAAVGNEMQTQSVQQLITQLHSFQTNLSSFASKHRTKIAQNPIFRSVFTETCVKLGVDVLNSNKSWSLIGVGEFYNELSVQLIEICLINRSINGGIMGVNEIIERLNKRRRKFQSANQSTQQAKNLVSIKDIEIAIKEIQILTPHFRLIKLKDRSTDNLFVCSVPHEFNTDELWLIECLMQTSSYTFNHSTFQPYRWPQDRVDKLINTLIDRGLVWIDEQPDGQIEYAFYSLFIDHRAKLGQDIADQADEMSNTVQ